MKGLRWEPLWLTPKCPLPGSQFCVSRAYEGSQVDELSVPAGARVQVLEMSDRGWWLCRCGALVGEGGSLGGWAGPSADQTLLSLQV